MSNVFQVVSTDKDSVNEIRTLSEMCKVKLLMDDIVNDENSNENEVLSTLAALAPEETKSKRHYGKIHSFKNPDVNGFVKSNGKIKYGNVGINEKVNTSIHNKNLRSAQMNKRGDDITLMNFKQKLSNALYNIKTLAVQKVTNSFTNLEVNVNVLLEDNLFISDPEGNREKAVLTEEILDNIKNILNSEPDEKVTEVESEAIEEAADIPTELVELFESLPVEIIANRKKSSSLDGVFQIDESEENEVYIAEAATTAVSSDEEDAEETTVPVNKEEEEEEEEVDEESTDLVPVPDDGEEGEDEEEAKEESAIENTDTEEEEEEEETTEDVPPSPPSLQGPPDVQPEVPKVTPNKPTNPHQMGRPGQPGQPWKFGWPAKPSQNHQNNHYHGKPSILHTINKLFGDTRGIQTNKYHNHNHNHNHNYNNPYNKKSTGLPASYYMPTKKWFMKKRNYVVSNELLNEREEVMNEALEEEIKVQVDTMEDMPAETIKLNNPENHRDNNDDEEVFELGAKKVSIINNIRPVKPTLNFRKNDKKRDTH